MSIEDEQQLLGAEDEEKSIVSLEGVDTMQVEPIGSDVLGAEEYCKLGSSDEDEGKDDKVSDHTWVPYRAEKERERNNSREAECHPGAVQRTGERSYHVPLDSRASLV